MTAPEAPNADLIELAQELVDEYQWSSDWDKGQAAPILSRLIATLGDTVPREQHERHLAANRWPLAQLREARAERDALAAKIKLAHNACDRCEGSGWINPTIDDAMPCDAPLHDVLTTVPAVSLALHDAEVKAQALDEVREAWNNDWSDVFDVDEQVGNAEAVGDWLDTRAAAIREETSRG